uniref:ShKT domain-containing protein n=1 Tax=Panagrolaimus superbus TaxID=310955 RepID=A0A914YDS7_9BILA
MQNFQIGIFSKKILFLSSNICATLSISNGLWEIESCKTLKSYICTFSTSSSAASADDEIPATTTIPTITTQSSDDDDVTTDGCLDEISSCQQYLNECSDPDYQPMLYKFCRKTCNLCGQCMDSNPQCPQLAAGGFCTNPEDKWTECSKTCKLC